MDKLDFAILNALQESNATNRIQGISRKQILETVEIGSQNLFLRVKKLITHEVISNGLKDGREHTFFITEKGLNIFEEELG